MLLREKFTPEPNIPGNQNAFFFDVPFAIPNLWNICGHNIKKIPGHAKAVWASRPALSHPLAWLFYSNI